MLVLAAPIAVVAWLAADELTARERRHADARLGALLRTADGELAAALAVADADARGLARAPAVRLAVIRRDVEAVARLGRTFPGLVIRVHGRMLTVRSPGVAHLRAAPVTTADGRVVGSIAIATRLDRALLLRLRERAPVRLLFELRGRVVAAAGVAAGGVIVLSGLGPASVTVASGRYRALATAVPDSAARLVALLPLEVVQEAEDTQVRAVVLAAVLLLFALTLAADATSAVIRRRRR